MRRSTTLRSNCQDPPETRTLPGSSARSSTTAAFVRPGRAAALLYAKVGGGLSRAVGLCGAMGRWDIWEAKKLIDEPQGSPEEVTNHNRHRNRLKCRLRAVRHGKHIINIPDTEATRSMHKARHVTWELTLVTRWLRLRHTHTHLREKGCAHNNSPELASLKTRIWTNLGDDGTISAPGPKS